MAGRTSPRLGDVPGPEPDYGARRRTSDALGLVVAMLAAMRVILNVLWLFLAGFWLAVGYALAGVVMLILIITIPFGLQSFKLASYALWPFGRKAVRRGHTRVGSVIGNIIWILLAGWWLALAHLVTAMLLAITIVGLPLAAANIKMIPLSFAPFGREIVRVGDPRPPI